MLDPSPSADEEWSPQNLHWTWLAALAESVEIKKYDEHFYK